VTVNGRLLRGGRDTVPLGGAWTVLHRVAQGGGAPLDSVRTDTRGRYRFRLSGVDSAAVYVTSASYDGIAYFSLPIAPRGGASRPVDDLVVFPTTRDGPPIRVARRLLTAARPATDGTREVLEILELENTGFTTRVTDDTVVTTWVGALPHGTVQFQPGQGDISPDAMARRGDSVRVFGPIPPGRGHQLSFGYVIPAGTSPFVVPIDQPILELNLLVEDTTAVVAAPGIESLGVQAIEQRRFAAYRAGPLAAGATVTIGLPGGAFRPQSLLPYVIALLAAAMASALVWALKRKPSAISRQPSV
jgi:hypothetical protein